MPKHLFNRSGLLNYRRRQRKMWSRMVDDLFKYLDIDKAKVNGWRIYVGIEKVHQLHFGLWRGVC